MKRPNMQKLLHWILIALVMVLLLGCCIPMSPALLPEEPLIGVPSEEPAQPSKPAEKDDEEIRENEETDASAPATEQPAAPELETVTVACSYCIGTGRCVDCIDGECFLCGGTGEQECFGCLDGECMDCSGDGYTYETNFYTGDSEKKKCGSCNGSGNCRTCGGSGKEDCDECGGSKNCGSCGGAVECPYCGGSGIGGETVVQNTAPQQEQETHSEAEQSGLYLATGTAGSLSWELSRDSILVISGNGAMPNYDRQNIAPWRQYSDLIGRVVIDDGVTSIGTSAFYNCRSIFSVSLPDSVTVIGDTAFMDCISLTGMDLPDHLTEIGGSAFSGCTSISELTIPASVTTLGIGPFHGWTSAQTIYFESSALNSKGPQTISGITYNPSPIWKSKCNAKIIWPD